MTGSGTNADGVSPGAGDQGPTTTGSPIVSLEASLSQWRPISAEQEQLKAEYLAFLRSMPAPLERSGGPEHITASCFVFSPDFKSVLLCFHKKGQFWVQLGGHIEETDASVAAAALREAREEGGIPNLTPLGSLPVDVNRHGLSGSFGSCRVHWDIGCAVIAAADSLPVTSDESEDVAWWGVDALPQNVPPKFAERLGLALAEARLAASSRG